MLLSELVRRKWKNIRDGVLVNSVQLRVVIIDGRSTIIQTLKVLHRPSIRNQQQTSNVQTTTNKLSKKWPWHKKTHITSAKWRSVNALYSDNFHSLKLSLVSVRTFFRKKNREVDSVFEERHKNSQNRRQKREHKTENIKIKHNSKYSKTKLPWFGRLLRHSARKQSGLTLQCSWAYKEHTSEQIQWKIITDTDENLGPCCCLDGVSSNLVRNVNPLSES